jgi:hypothetical protein
LTPYYLFAHDANYDPDAAAGTNFEFRVEGDGPVPSFDVGFIAPVPIHELQPLPHGDGSIDFGRSEGVVFAWDPSLQAGDRVQLGMLGVDAAGDGPRRTLCVLDDDGVFSVPVGELMRFGSGPLTISITRVRRHYFTRPGLTGNGLLEAFHAYVPLDDREAGIPLIYEID